MAVEDDNTEAQADEGAKPGKKKLIIIAAAIVLVLAIGGGVAAFFLMSGDTAEEVTAEAEAVAPSIEAIYTKIRTTEGKPMFVVSLESDDNELHYMQLYVEAKSRDATVDEALQQHMPVVVARLNALFSSQSYKALMKVENKRAMREQATEIVKEILQDKIGQPGIESILFTNLVMQ